MELVSQPNVSASELTEVIEKDPNLTVRVMKLANSAYYGLPQKISTLSHAVMILGFKTVRNLVTSIYMHDAFFSSKVATDKISTNKIWWHLIATAVATESVSNAVGYINKEETFLVGMIHDLGKMVVAKLFPSYTNAIVELASRASITYFDAEQKLELPDHVSIVEHLVEKWGFPKEIKTAVALHHDPEKVKDENLKDITYISHVADVIANILDPKAAGNYALPPLNKEAWAYLNLDGPTFLNITREARGMTKKATEFFNL
jgi:HD-like signal output (HDOD) protein